MSERTIIGIKPAAAIREQTKHTQEFESACGRVMADIEKAAAEGRYHTFFDPRPYHLREDIQSAFQREGYTFRDMGKVAGVMQQDVFICW